MTGSIDAHRRAAEERGWSTITPAMESALMDCLCVGTGVTIYRDYLGAATTLGANPITHTDATLKAAVAAACETERQRILALLDKIKPGEEPYTRKSWNDERVGEMRMFERMVKAIGEPQK